MKPGFNVILEALLTGIENTNKHKDNAMKIIAVIIAVVIGSLIIPIVAHFVKTVYNEVTV